jgi:hypothetical protein
MIQNQQFVVEVLASDDSDERCYNSLLMLQFILSILAAVGAFFRSRADIAMEILALRQQVAVLKRKRPRTALSCWER